MKRIIVLAVFVLLFNPISAEATKPIKYQNQKAGQFCKNVEVGKFVRPSGTEILECKKDGKQARWTSVDELPFKNQQKGQFCKVADIGSVVQIADKSILRCNKDGSRARWQDA